jgi:membrane protein DedA with SNARE-associated domain
MVKGAVKRPSIGPYHRLGNPPGSIGGDARSLESSKRTGTLRLFPPGGGAGLLAFLNDLVTALIGDYGYLAVFVLMVLESACVPVPSEVTMLFGGALASAAFAGPGQELDFVAVGLLGTAGNLVGSWLAYWAGAVGGRPLVDRFGRYLLVLPHEVDRAHEWFERRGELAVFVSRLLPVIRTFISLPAGVAKMSFWRFTIYTILGCLPWTFALAWLGYALGENWTKVEDVLQPIAWAIAGVVVLAGVWWIARRYRRVRAAYAELDAASRSEVAE